MKEYEGAANNALALSKFVFSVKEVLDSGESERRKLEKIDALMSGPNVLPEAYAAQSGNEA